MAANTGSTSVNTETDFSQAILKIADANNIIKEKQAVMDSLDAQVAELTAAVTKLEADKASLETENRAILVSMEDLTSQIEPRKLSVENAVAEELAKIDVKRAELEAQTTEMNTTIAEHSNILNEANRLRIENINSQNDIDSKSSALAQRESAANYAEAQAQERLNQAKTEELRLINLKQSIETKTAEQNAAFARTEESRASASSMTTEIQEKMEALNVLQQSVGIDKGNIDFLINQIKPLVSVLRESLHTYCQLSGTAISIPNLDDTQKEIIARTIAPFLFDKEGNITSVIFKS